MRLLRLVLAVSFTFSIGCATAEDTRPGDRSGRGEDEERQAPPTPEEQAQKGPSPCLNGGGVVQAAGTPRGKSDEIGGTITDPLVTAGDPNDGSPRDRRDDLIIETKDFSADQSGWSFNIGAVGYGDFDTCKVCVYILLDDRKFLMAETGQASNVTIQREQTMSAEFTDLVFREAQEVNGDWQTVPGGCQLMLPSYRLNAVPILPQ